MEKKSETLPRSGFRDEIDEFLAEWAHIENGLGREIGEMRPWFWRDEFAPPIDAPEED